MIYGEMEFLGISDVPHISTMFYINPTKWVQWMVRLTDESLEIQTDDSITAIPLKDILFVDRPLSQAIASKVQNSSRHGAVMVIDYKKKATIGIGDILFSMIFAGKKTDVYNLKYLLMSLLGLKVDPLVGSMRAEDIRLLCLLASGVNKMDMLIPIFDGEEDLLYRAFAALKTKDLVDEYASLTPMGVEIVDKVRGVERKKMGLDVVDKFEELKKVWDCLDTLSTTHDTNRILWKCGDSSLCGNVSIADIMKYLPLKEIAKIKIEMGKNSSMNLVMHTTKDTNILLKSHDHSVIFALYGILNMNEDTQIRILFCLYLGYTSENEILHSLQMPSFKYDYHYQALLDKKLLDEQSRELTNKGLGLVYNKIVGDASVLLHYHSLDHKSGNFKRFEQIKKENAKKKVLNALQSKHVQIVT
ncbi:MAG: hypothetical protein SCH66_13445 [Methanolobus sp.]|nr:hypothetical protein [Methanolobus sp.]